MRYLYIHGANSTSQSFNYIRDRLGGDDMVLDYVSSEGFDHNFQNMCSAIDDSRDLFIIAHSLGGIYALHLANQFPRKVRGAVTISTPYGGSGAAEIAKWFMPHTQLFRDIAPSGRIIRSTMRMPVQHPWCNIVSTRGNSPWIMLSNDGVVTLQSMRARPEMDLIELDLNHYEVMMNPATVEIIQARIRL